MKKTIPAALLSAALLTVGISGCGSDESTDAASTDTASTDTTSTDAGSTATAPADGLEVVDPWIKAAGEGEMTGLFGTLANSGEEDVVVVAVTSDVSPMIELHETVMADDGSMMMQPKEGGFTVPAGGEHALEPGGDHVMLMDLGRALEPGEVVALTLTLDDGTTVDVDATVKPFEGGNEQYQPSDGM